MAQIYINGCRWGGSAGEFSTSQLAALERDLGTENALLQDMLSKAKAATDSASQSRRALETELREERSRLTHELEEVQRRAATREARWKEELAEAVRSKDSSLFSELQKAKDELQEAQDSTKKANEQSKAVMVQLQDSQATSSAAEGSLASLQAELENERKLSAGLRSELQQESVAATRGYSAQG